MAEKRVFYANGSELTVFESNYTSTTKYTALTFLPMSLLSQFMRIPNIYFLITAILQSIPEISPLNPLSAIAPLVFVIGVSMIREGIEDYMRYRSDQEINSATTLCYKQGQFQETPYKDVQVGDIVQVRENEVFPCDLIMLSNPNDNGIAFIETSTLDGEKNLKPRFAFNKTMETLDKNKLRILSLIECEAPNAKIEQFNGKIVYEGETHSLTKGQLLQCGAFLRNTKWAIGVAVYTGNETKLRKNLLSRRIKMSTVEHKMNKYILWIIACQFLLCLIGAVSGGIWAAVNYDDHWYLGEAPYSSSVQGFLNFFTYFLLLNTMLPISLIISLEIVKMGQGLCMQRDPELFSRVRERYCKVSSFSLNEELGMIQHVFTDKTGTLTSNRMEFKCCTIGRITYGEQRARAGTIPRVATYTDKIVNFTFKPRALQEDTFNKLPSDEFEPLPMCSHNTTDMFDSQAKLNRFFLRCLALCHECLAKVDDEGKVHYSGQSPDEISLVDCARWVGYAYSKTRGDMIDVEVQYGSESVVERYQKLCLFEFNSDRKRNSIIVTDKDNGEHYLFCKGADNIIFERLSPDNNPRFIKGIKNEVNKNSKQGLRTLLLCFKLLSPAEFEEIAQEYHQLSIETDNREAKIEEFAEKVERDMFLLGCTAVEDALQDEVPATLNDFLAAGINVWMLTGDKMETAENIGQTCSLLNSQMLIWKITATTLTECQEQLRAIRKDFEKKDPEQPKALIVQGEALEFVLYHESYASKYPVEEREDLAKLSDTFFNIAQACKTIICCRATPGQKQSVVKSMKLRTNCVTLAIGDGANDVSMILEAHIGIGLYGEEGMQAVQSSDYAIGEFKYLWELLFVHGRFNYIRQSDMIVYFFYKNLVFTLPQFFFMFICAYSGQTVYDDWYITMYNLMFTALPLLVRALFDYDVAIPKRSEIGRPEHYLMDTHVHPNPFAKVRKTVPCVYAIGKNNQLFTPFNFLLWMLTGVFHSLLVCYLPLAAASEGVLGKHAHTHSLWTYSIASFTCVILLVNLKMGYCTRNWNLWTYIAIFGSSVLLYIVFILVYDGMATTPSYLTLYELLGSHYFYFTVVMLVMLVIVVDGAVHCIRRFYFPTESEQLMDFSLKVQNKKSNKKVAEEEIEENLNRA